jgi:hypothetical protein
MIASIAALALLLASALAIPTPAKPLMARQQDPAALLLSIAPSSGTCSGAPFPSECATASTAVDPIISSFALCNIDTGAEQAALLAWMSYESGDFKYNQNHFPAPGTPGQGTRNMMSPTFVAEYVQFLGLTPTSTDPATVLAMVENDQYGFGSASWYYHEKCSDDIKTGVQSGSQAGWDAFLTTCVGTNADEGSGSTSRLAYWQRATAALGVQTS